jgi:hypothetical protein
MHRHPCRRVRAHGTPLCQDPALASV